MEVNIKRSALEKRLADLQRVLCTATEPDVIKDYKKAIRKIKRLLDNKPEPPAKEYSVKTKFVFKGTFTVKAHDKKQAREFVEKHCGLVLGGDIHTTLPDEIIDWNFSVHPQKIVR